MALSPLIIFETPGYKKDERIDKFSLTIPFILPCDLIFSGIPYSFESSASKSL